MAFPGVISGVGTLSICNATDTMKRHGSSITQSVCDF